jgi:hypothetical protein
MRTISARGAAASPKRVAAAAVLLAASACGPGRRAAGEAIFPYIDAVQTSNYETLRCLYAGSSSPGPEFNSWVDGRLAAFDEGKARGHVGFESDGIAMIKALGLGTGTLLGIASVTSKGDELEVLTPATFNYDEIDAPALPNGATFLVAVLPLGTVTTVKVREGSGRMTLDPLKSLTLRWTLRRIAPEGGCGSEWGVSSVATVPSSAKTVRVEWRF